MENSATAASLFWMIFFNFYVLTAGVTHGITFTLMDFKHQKYETFVSAIVQRIVNKQTVVNRIVVVLTETEILCMCWCDHHFSFIYGSIKHHHKKTHRYKVLDKMFLNHILKWVLTIFKINFTLFSKLYNLKIFLCIQKLKKYKP